MNVNWLITSSEEGLRYDTVIETLAITDVLEADRFAGVVILKNTPKKSRLIAMVG